MLRVVLQGLADGSLGAAMPDYVLGLAIAGSYARGEQTPYSDLDMFAILDAENPHDYQVRIEDFLRRLPRPLLRRGPLAKLHFGDQVTLVYEDASVVQINFNTESALELNPMRGNSRVVLDRTGRYRQLVAAARSVELDAAQTYAEYSDWFLIRGLACANAIRKGEILKASGYLYEMRVALAQLLRMERGRFYPTRNPYLPLSRFEQEVGDAPAGALGALFPAYSVESVRGCLAASLRLFEEVQERSGSRHDYDLSAFHALATTAFGDGAR